MLFCTAATATATAPRDSNRRGTIAAGCPPNLVSSLVTGILAGLLLGVGPWGLTGADRRLCIYLSNSCLFITLYFMYDDEQNATVCSTFKTTAHTQTHIDTINYQVLWYQGQSRDKEDILVPPLVYHIYVHREVLLFLYNVYVECTYYVDKVCRYVLINRFEDRDYLLNLLR